MQTYLSFQNRRREPGLVLSLDRDSMRVALPGRTDVIELRSVDGEWISESGELVQVEGLFAISWTEQAELARAAASALKTMTA